MIKILTQPKSCAKIFIQRSAGQPRDPSAQDSHGQCIQKVFGTPRDLKFAGIHCYKN